MSEHTLRASLVRAGTFSAAALVGVWLYATLNIIFGSGEAYWWGGKGWFVPGIGTILLLLAAAPSYWLVEKLFSRVNRLSYPVLATIGFLQGFSFFVVLLAVASLANAILMSISFSMSAWSEIFLLCINVLISMGICTLTPALLFRWWLNRGECDSGVRSHRTN